MVEKKQSNPFSGFFANAKRNYEENSKPMNYFGLVNDFKEEPKKVDKEIKTMQETKDVDDKKNFLEKSIAEIKLEKIKRILAQ